MFKHCLNMFKHGLNMLKQGFRQVLAIFQNPKIQKYQKLIKNQKTKAQDYLMAYANAADPLICVISGFGFLKEFAKECGSVVNVADCIGL